MKELSIFVDESGDFGDYAEHSSYYIISLVLHDQTIDIRDDVDWLETRLAELGYPNHCMHSGPVIRNEQEYRKDTIEKKHIQDPLEAVARLAKQLSSFIRENYTFFMGFDVVKVYYDNGQVEVTKLLSSVFVSLLENVEFRRVFPSDYRLFQVADLVCSLKLLDLKKEKNELAKTEMLFFEDERTLQKKYLKPFYDKSSSMK